MAVSDTACARHVGPDTLSRKEVTACLVQLGEAAEIDVEMENVLEAEVAANIPHPISWSKLGMK